jgi:hypothetical protein
MPSDGLTSQQLATIKFLRDFHAKHGYYATLRDVQRKFHHESVSTAHRRMLVLFEKGRVERLQITRETFVWVPVER